MMRLARRCMIIIVINIGLLILAATLIEYWTIQDKLLKLERVVQRSVDAAVESSVTAEELFGENKGLYESNTGGFNDEAGTALVWATNGGSGQLYSLNQYALAVYLAEHPNKTIYNLTSGDISSAQDSYTANKAFELMYGQVGINRNNDWAIPKSKREKYAYLAGLGYTDSREPTTNFENFYISIGSASHSVQSLKERRTIGSRVYYTLVEKDVSPLLQMGLKLSEYNEATTGYTVPITNEKYLSSIKPSSFGSKSKFFHLTPYSLGITYVPTEVLVPLVQNNININARFLALNGLRSNNTADANSIMNKATGCMKTNVFFNGGAIADSHSSATNTYGNPIVSDGDVEYDLSTIKCKVDYFCFDYAKAVGTTRLSRVISYLDGDESGYSYSPYASPTVRNFGGSTLAQYNTQKIMNSDSMYTYYNGIGKLQYYNGKRIIARVSVRLKVHIVYSSPILQWLCREYTGGAGHEHYDVKQVDVDTGTLYEGTTSDTDGVWYQYTTYIAVTR